MVDFEDLNDIEHVKMEKKLSTTVLNFRVNGV